MKIQPDNPPPRQAAMASAKGDLRKLKQTSGATVAELKAFLRDLKGRSPQEMLGIVASNQLVRAVGLSCVLVFIGILAFTAIPYAMGGKEEPAEKVKVAAEGKPAPEPAPVEPAAAPEQPPASDLSKLGVGEAKEAPPDKNPLENKTDDFLDGLDQ